MTWLEMTFIKISLSPYKNHTVLLFVFGIVVKKKSQT